MKGLSKSRYTAFCQCPKNLWLKVFNPEVATKDPALEARFERGNEVGDYAMQLFGEFVEVTTQNADGSLNYTTMVEKTKEEMAKGTENICEASFATAGHYCAVDILRKNGDGWDIYEVKSSTYKGDEKDTPESLLVYTRDIAYQKWLLEQCGVKVNGTYLVRLNKFYVRGKKLDLQQLFHIRNMDDVVANEYLKVPSNVNLALKALGGPEPDEPIEIHCHKPYHCAFFDYCKRLHGVPEDEPTVFDLYNVRFSKMCKLYNEGKVRFEDLVSEKLGEVQKLQVSTYLNNSQLVTPAEIREFLKKLTYPLYFLDFETMQDAIPKFEGTRPYQQIPFQYSLHWIEKEGEDPKHKDFLGDSVNDPRRALAEKLCNEIPKGVCTTAYNKGFECGRLKELAAAYPDLSDHLLDIADHIVDLIEPFHEKMVYLPEMEGSFSIKHVLPALQPDWSYDDLGGSVHNGGEAMTLYPQIVRPGRSPEEIEADRKSLLEYCKLDTLAMVEVWKKLIEMSK